MKCIIKMKKNLLKSLFAMVCLLGNNSVSAYDFEVDGLCYDVVSLNDQTCKIASYGDKKYSGSLVIPATVTYGNRTLTVVEIASYAFYRQEEIISVTIPNTVTNIEDNAFQYCSKLQSVKIEDGETVLTLGHNQLIIKNIGGMFN